MSAEQTENIAEEYAKNLRGGDVVLLKGDMGAGKTVFAKGVAKALGIEDEITSPTYAYMNDYDGKLYHFDLYRITSEEHALSLGLTDYFYAGGVSLVEWSERIPSLIPEKVKTVVIEDIGDGKRKITL